ncbi:MAG: MBL fold metallo-hydrolase [Candidatus Dormibacteraeota bacterium]|nr:MBL fold metallo-hydrolase [Candidatus Dormibacteraeota bacterium]
MEPYVCRTCGVQQAPSEAPPSHCAICDDERQYVPPQGQEWATLAELRAEGHAIEVRDLEPRLIGVGAKPQVGIGQRALLVQTDKGNVLWDCLGFVDEAGIAAVRDRGGLQGIAMSHPHFYGVCVEWSHAFGGAPIYIPAADREWVMRPDPVVKHWEGTLEPLPGLTLIQTGGHFEGSAVLHWAAGADGRGALLTGDSITVVADRRFVSFMRSYPNVIPLSAAEVTRIVSSVRPYPFDRVYGGWWDRVMDRDGKAAINRSADRYITWLEGRASSSLTEREASP